MNPIPDLKIKFAVSRSDLADELRERCEKKDVDNEAVLWENAWRRFKIENSHYIPRPKAFSVSDRRSANRRKVFKKKYRILAVKHFLPYFEKKVPFLTGNIKERYNDVIGFLRYWKSTIPVELLPVESSQKILDLEKSMPPPIITLPTPPMFKTVVEPRPDKEGEGLPSRELTVESGCESDWGDDREWDSEDILDSVDREIFSKVPPV